MSTALENKLIQALVVEAKKSASVGAKLDALRQQYDDTIGPLVRDRDRLAKELEAAKGNAEREIEKTAFAKQQYEHTLVDVRKLRGEVAAKDARIADLESALKVKGPLTIGVALSNETQKVVELNQQLQIALPEIIAFRTALRRLVSALSESERSPDLTDAYEAAVAVLDVKPDHYHPDNIAIDRFADAMKAKMARKRAEGRGGWDDPAQCQVGDLAKMLVDHLPKGDPVDIGNFAMMLFHREGGDRALVDMLNAPPPAPSNDKASDGVDYRDMNDGDLMKAIGLNGRRWAAAFCQKFGGDEGNMLGWFANAIEAGRRDIANDLDGWRELCVWAEKNGWRGRGASGCTALQFCLRELKALKIVADGIETQKNQPLISFDDGRRVFFGGFRSDLSEIRLFVDDGKGGRDIIPFTSPTKPIIGTVERDMSITYQATEADGHLPPERINLIFLPANGAGSALTFVRETVAADIPVTAMPHEHVATAPQPMTQEEFDNLQPGDVIRKIDTGKEYEIDHRAHVGYRVNPRFPTAGFNRQGAAMPSKWSLVRKAPQPQPPVPGTSDTL